MADPTVVAHHPVVLDCPERGDVEVDGGGSAVHAEVGRDCVSGDGVGGDGVGGDGVGGVGHGDLQCVDEPGAQLGGETCRGADRGGVGDERVERIGHGRVP